MHIQTWKNKVVGLVYIYMYAVPHVLKSRILRQALETQDSLRRSRFRCRFYCVWQYFSGYIYIYIQFKFSDCVKKYILVYLEVCMYLWCTSIYPEMHRCTCTYPYYRFYFLGYEMEGPLNALGNKPLPSVLSKLVLYSFIHSCDVGWIIAYIPCANKLEHQSHSCNMYNQIVWCNILIYLLHIYTHTHVFLYMHK